MSRITSRISNREFEVLNLISLGFKIHEIAKRLYISDHTVISHRKNLYSKLEVCNAALLVRKAFDIGILKPSYQYFTAESNAA